MTRLKKQDRNEQLQQPQQLEIAENFPDLAAKAEKPKEAKSKSKKKKNKGIGSLISDLSPPEPAKAPPGVADSLAAAAALSAAVSCAMAIASAAIGAISRMDSSIVLGPSVRGGFR